MSDKELLELESLQAELAESKIEFNQCSGLLDDALRSIEIIEAQRDELEAEVVGTDRYGYRRNPQTKISRKLKCLI